MILRAFLCKNLRTLRRLFECYISLILEYGSVLWCPYTNKHIDKKIETVQKKFITFIFFRSKGSSPSYVIALERLSVRSLVQRRLVAKLRLVHKFFNGKVANPPNFLFTLPLPILVRNQDHCFVYTR
ncbi:hypothetical protein L596_008669 [Steinernema carpocapsae]|uniref:Uncharacterized protein n=1 Tax=Steinernema carpocapsae TaxID=34508 RepID=A0A4U5PDF8_STECR|nr:hypothetical protein L596_008669 [Steinernema carpocapsae]